MLCTFPAGASDFQFTVLMDDIVSRLPTAKHASVYDSLNLARAGVYSIYAHFLGVDAYNAEFWLHNQTTNEYRLLNCSAGQQQGHFRLEERCQPDPKYAPQDCTKYHSEAASPLDAAYHAYMVWCNPSICTCIKPKTRYQVFLACIATLGGVYSACTIVMYLCWLIFRVGLDGI